MTSPPFLWRSGAAIFTVASQQAGHRFDSNWRLSAFRPRVLLLFRVRSLQVIQLPPRSPRMWTLG